MNKIKYLLLVLFLFLLSGCTVDYKLVINENTLDEVVTFSESISNINDITNFDDFTSYNDAIDELNKNPQHVLNNANINPYDLNQIVDGVSYYDKEILNDNLNYGIIGKYNYKFNEYSDSRLLLTCYAKVAFLESDTYTLSTSPKFLCFDKYFNLDEVNVTITVDNKYTVISSNADSVTDNIYIWNITRNNSNNKSIVLELAKAKKDNNYKGQNIIVILFIVTSLICLLGIILYIIIKSKNISKNKI